VSELPELYWSPSRGLTYRTAAGTYDVDLRDDHPMPVFTGDEIHADAVRLVVGRAAAELPVIPGKYRFQRDRVTFVTYEDEWHLIGPARMLPIGHLVFVDRFADDTNQEVLVGVHVAERTVRHGNGDAITYAIAKIDKGA
jgi:hypothetical protein